MSYYYSIKEQLSKEENLELAQAYTNKATELLTRFKAIIDEANKEFPGRTFGLSKTKLAKHKSPNEAYERVFNATRTFMFTKSTYETRERMEAEKIKEQEQIEFTKKIEAEKNNLANEAITYCLANGRIFGQDGLNIDTAIAIANDIAFNKEVAKREAEIGDGYIGFSGQNCEDECDGWNPKDRRCQCGNRRVSWTDEYSDFRDMSIYAEAY
jgi:hypothetical protein